MKTFLLVDGNAVLHRAFHATPPLTTSKGELINAAFGFTSMLLSCIQQQKPDYIAIAWDMKAPTFRHQAYTQYKATRPETDHALGGQYDRVHEIVKAFNIPEFSLAGYEADDLIGTLSLLAHQDSDIEVVVMTGDRDIMQMIRPRIKVLMPRKSLSDVTLYGAKEFVDKFGFKPTQLIDYKALAGDASDNIPGVPGIGDVTATKLIKEFNNLENIYLPRNLATLPERTQKLLAEGAESAKMSQQLATIDTNAPIKLDLNKCLVHDFDRQKVVDLFTEIEFKSLIPRIPGHTGVEDVSARPEQSAPTTDLDNAVTPVLEKMSKNGIMIDLPLLKKIGTGIRDRLSIIEKDIYHHVGHQFNLNSPKQLADVLFDELNLPVIRKTKTGRSTDEATLQELKAAHPAIPLLLEYRQLFKLISTYVDTLPKFADSNSRVHSTFNVEGAATGRLSSTNPNLQNIPIKGDLGGELRKVFIIPEGKVLLGADYSQIELRIMAHIADDPNLKKAFEEGVDIHSATAAKIFGIPIDQVTKQQRMVGKTMNFATMYGQGPHALGQQLGVDYKVAKAYIDTYFEQFPKVLAWKAQILKEAEKKGYVETIWGRRRYIPELQSSNHMLKASGERAAVNHPLQGTQADMIKKAMVDIDKELHDSPCLMVLQVHDELLFECPKDDVEATAQMVKDKMENALKLSIPVIVELKVGPNWGEMTKLKLDN